jgi:hypothetical protein
MLMELSDTESSESDDAAAAPEALQLPANSTATASSLLQEAEDLIKALLQLSSGLRSDTTSSVLKADSKRAAQSLVLKGSGRHATRLTQAQNCSIETQLSALRLAGPITCGQLDTIVYNTYDREAASGYQDPSKADRHTCRKDARKLNLYSLTFRVRNMHAITDWVVMKSIELHYNGTGKKPWEVMTQQREVLSREMTYKILESQPFYSEPTGFAASASYIILVRDNLELWLQVKTVRTIDGKKIESRLIHCITGEDVPIPADLVISAPTDDVWAVPSRYSMKSEFIPSRAEFERRLSTIWNKFISQVKNETMSLFDRPSPDQDQYGGHSRTVTHHSPIMIDVGTSDAKDIMKVMDAALVAHPEKKIILVGDNQTFKNMWWAKFRHQARYRLICPFGGELHQHMHEVDAIYLLDWDYIYEPICMLLGRKGIHKKFYAKEHNNKIRLMTLVLTAGYKWLLGISGIDCLDNPLKLIEQTEKNLPVSNFIKHMFYHSNFVAEHRQAIRTADVDFLNFSWRYDLCLCSPTRKFNYKKMTVQMGKVLFDTEPNIRNILSKYRTFRKSGIDCNNEMWDDCIEQVFSIMIQPYGALQGTS